MLLSYLFLFLSVLVQGLLPQGDNSTTVNNNNNNKFSRWLNPNPSWKSWTCKYRREFRRPHAYAFILRTLCTELAKYIQNSAPTHTHTHTHTNTELQVWGLFTTILFQQICPKSVFGTGEKMAKNKAWP